MTTTFISPRNPHIRFFLSDGTASPAATSPAMHSALGGRYVSTDAPGSAEVGTYVTTGAPQPGWAGSYVTTTSGPSGTMGSYVHSGK